MSDAGTGSVPCGARGAVLASVVSAVCLVRALPLFVRPAPATPLRVLGIVALDTLHVLRRSRWLPRERIGPLAMFLDFEGMANAALDHKPLCEVEYRELRVRLRCAGLGHCMDDYLARLRALEGDRPAIGGDGRHFNDVRTYREAVARLSLMMAVHIALAPSWTAEGAATARADEDVETLLRILMQCQIIDDVLDYREDLAAGLPSFLTACTSLSQAVALTAESARAYGRVPARMEQGIFPLRVALLVVTGLARAMVGVMPARPRNARQFAR